MASHGDVLDILGLPAGGDASKPAAKQRKKATAPVKRPQGVAREVAALYGERPPPVSVYQEEKTYRAKRQNAGPAKQWIQERFTNTARSDGLVLRHWARKDASAAFAASDEDTPMEDGGLAVQPVVASDKFAKYNVAVDVPTFTDEEYDACLRSASWSREETDYLLGLVRDYAQRWAVVWDRYDYKPQSPVPKQEAPDGDSQALQALPFAPVGPATRTVEDLKARFYSIQAALMKRRIPEVHMDAEQYALYETLCQFEPQLERNRKELAAQLMGRPLDECKEEEFLLTELQRITMQANRLDAERAELRARLDTPTPNTTNQLPGINAFPSSQALTTLFGQLLNADKTKKRQSGAAVQGAQGARPSLSNDASGSGTPLTAAQHQAIANSRRQSTAQPQQQPPTPLRQLTPLQLNRFNVSSHDRLTSGVSFGSDRLLKMRQAKSNVQTQKIATVLQQLQVPDIIPIPTSRVAEAFEVLVGKVGRMLDVRKVREKEESECKVLEAMKSQTGLNGTGATSHSAGGTGGKDASSDFGASTVKRENTADDVQAEDEDADADGEPDEDEDEDDADEDGDGDNDPDAEGEDDSRAASVSTRTAGHKRSASVLSHTSNRDAKKARK